MVPVETTSEGADPAGGQDPGPAGRAVPAATVVPLRDAGGVIEVLLLRRSKRGAFGGMWVFPGGQVDVADSGARPADPEASVPEASGAGSGGGRTDPEHGVAHGRGGPAEIAAARRAAVREAKEEADLDLDEASLVTHSFWMPPAEAPRQFATWFFLAPAGGEIVVDHGEIREHRWLSPAEGMAARDRGEIQLAPPTFVTLWWLSRRRTVAEALSDAAAREPERFRTRVAIDGSGRVGATLWAGDAGYDDGNLERPGPRRRMWMDPEGWRVEIDG